jgi:hypothetical protein
MAVTGEDAVSADTRRAASPGFLLRTPESGMRVPSFAGGDMLEIFMADGGLGNPLKP